MEQYHLYAYEVLGLWHITMSVRSVDDHGEHWDSVVYRGDHVPIDEQDPLVRAVLILHQVESDLNAAIRGEVDSIAETEPAH